MAALRLTSSRSLGGVQLLDRLRKQLGIDTALWDLLGPRGSPRTWNGCCSHSSPTAPSTRPVNGRRCTDVAIDGLTNLSEDQAHRAMDLRVEADVTAEVQEAVFFAVALEPAELNLDVDEIGVRHHIDVLRNRPVGEDGTPGFGGRGTPRTTAITHDTGVRQVITTELTGTTPATHRLAITINHDARTPLETRNFGNS